MKKMIFFMVIPLLITKIFPMDSISTKSLNRSFKTGFSLENFLENENKHFLSKQRDICSFIKNNLEICFRIYDFLNTIVKKNFIKILRINSKKKFKNRFLAVDASFTEEIYDKLIFNASISEYNKKYVQIGTNIKIKNLKLQKSSNFQLITKCFILSLFHSDLMERCPEKILSEILRDIRYFCTHNLEQSFCCSTLIRKKFLKFYI